MKHEYQRVPVTALAPWHADTIITGEGCCLKAYDTKTLNVIATATIFDSQAIHGIAICDRREGESVALVWGHRLLCLVALAHNSENSVILTPCCTSETQDWILDAVFCPFSQADDQLAALITAHNALSLYSAAGDLHSASLQPTVPGSNCILYSACVTWVSNSNCLIASGTAFGDIIVWSARLTQVDGIPSAKSEVHYVFSAHQGSVFGISISPPGCTSGSDGPERLLASCSDDRTIRLWDISKLGVQRTTTDSAERPTGFGSHTDHEESAPPCLGKVMGHVSRIWHVRFVQTYGKGIDLSQSRVEGPAFLVSLGEDASLIAWTIERHSGLHGSPYALRQFHSQKAHAGKHIWAVCISDQLRIATGGADGAIFLSSFFDTLRHVRRADLRREILYLEEIKDKIKSYSFWAERALFVTTDNGKVGLLTLTEDDSMIYEEISPSLPGLRGYSLVASIPDAAFFAGTDGKTHMYVKSMRRSVLLCDTGSKVAGIFASKSSESLPGLLSPSVGVVVTNVGTSKAHFLQVSWTKSIESSNAYSSLHSAELQLPNGFVVTSFAWWAVSDRYTVILGSRNGSIACFSASLQQPQALVHSTRIYPAIHDREAITSMCVRASNEDPDSACILFTTGRDGMYAAHRLPLVNGQVELHTIHQLSLPFGPNVEGLEVARTGDIRVWGFRSKHFVVYSVGLQREIMTVECGGAHRNWVYQSWDHTSTFVWTKASRLFSETEEMDAGQVISGGGHGREIKAVAVSAGNFQVIATGAEDTDIKLNIIRSGHLDCLHTLRKHNTGIQQLRWSSDGRYLFSSGGFEEFFVWRISYDVPTLKIGVLCESVHPNCSTSDLRIMDFDIQEEHGGSQELAFMITMVYSDSSIKKWRYGERKWSFLASAEYTTACLTQCLFAAESIMTASTDGYVAFFSHHAGEENLRYVTRQRVHQNSILSLQICLLSDGSRLLISGGDDNAIGLTRISSKGHTNHVLLLSRAHTAAITALAIVKSQEDCIHFVSASIDQRVKLWKICANVSQPSIDCFSVRRLSDVFTAVADVSSIDLVRFTEEDRGVCICGAGIDLWGLESL